MQDTKSLRILYCDLEKKRKSLNAKPNLERFECDKRYSYLSKAYACLNSQLLENYINHANPTVDSSVIINVNLVL